MSGHGHGFGVGLYLPQGGAPPFSPNDLLPELWLKPDDLTAGVLANWPDSSVNARHVTQAVADSKPLVQVNQLDGYPGVLFDNVDDFMEIPNITTSAKDWDIYVVHSPVQYRTADMLMSAANTVGLLLLSGRNTDFGSNDGISWSQFGNSGGENRQELLNYRLGTEQAVELNGVRQGRVSGSPYVKCSFDDAGGSDPNCLGANYGNPESNFYNGHIHEVMVFSRILTDEEHDNLNAWFADKYPTLPLWTRPTTDPPEAAYGTLVHLLDETSGWTESVIGNDEIIALASSEPLANKLSLTWEAVSNSLTRTPSSANFNNYPTIWRGGAGEFFDADDGALIELSLGTYVAVLRPTNMGGILSPFDRISGGAGSAMHIYTNGSVNMEPGAGTFYEVAPSGTIVNLSTNIIIATYTAGSHFQGWVNGTKFSQPAGTPTGNMIIDRLSSSLTSSGDYEWAHLSIYNGVLSDANVALLGQFLSDKYGLGQTW